MQPLNDAMWADNNVTHYQAEMCLKIFHDSQPPLREHGQSTPADYPQSAVKGMPPGAASLVRQPSVPGWWRDICTPRNWPREPAPPCPTARRCHCCWQCMEPSSRGSCRHQCLFHRPRLVGHSSMSNTWSSICETDKVVSMGGITSFQYEFWTLQSWRFHSDWSICKLQVLGQPVTAEVGSNAQKWPNPVYANNLASDGATAKKNVVCSSGHWPHWPQMTKWYHDYLVPWPQHQIRHLVQNIK